MEYILKVLNKELEKREKRAKENFERLCNLEKEIERLHQENIILRKDLFELSKEHFKK
jgi:hypothetical protein